MSPRILRRIVWLVFVAGVIGMIFGSIRDSNGAAITAGIITAIAATALILITAVAPPGSLAKAPRDDEGVDAAPTPEHAVDERLARDLETRVTALVAAGADEEQVRLLVARAVDLGRARPPRT